MGRATVRAAVQAYLQGLSVTGTAAIPFLTQVYAHPPKLTPSGEFSSALDPADQTGVVIYIHLEDQAEQRIALGGPTSGEKFRTYAVVLICYLHSKKPRTEDVGADNDAFLDALTAAIEANRNAGNPSAVWQWGEGNDLYGSDLRVKAGMPRPLRQQSSQCFSTVDVTLIEALNT